MRLTVLQLAASWNDTPGVLARVDALLAEGPTDLVLLPEAALTGYVSPELAFDLAQFAEPEDGPTARALSALARRHRTALVGPLILRRGEQVYNTMIAFDAAGTRLFTYAKRHPWYPETWATAGEAPPPVVTVNGRRVTVAICYDAQFVEDDPKDALQAADVLLFASAWVDRDATRWPLLAGIARRYQLWIANANWSAGVVEILGQEDSCIVSPAGAVVAAAGSGERRLDHTI